ncbi:hypothetical protein [Nocardiopsis sp. NRRL B-16309]|uniref:hypothetical protein n=1 Tax=Nocardiopsis sp. NRRL B-16309 TaxID=1519494 RepID=UPI0006ADAA0D|nr:hypothetical protein [Nocardiopsis sp. NRRL B-16309]KOX23811.1 hypothetical protein ADL05_01765 [Nocardiopsis sp. NRRL B-16309]
MSATTSVTITDLAPSDIRLAREVVDTSSVTSLVIAGCHIDLAPQWIRAHQRAERIAALERLADLAMAAASELRRAGAEAT